MPLLAALIVCSPKESPASDTDRPSAILVSEAWVRQPPPGAAVAGAYLHLTNPGPRDDRLLAADSPAAERVEIHDMQVVSGMMQMRKLEQGLALPANATTVLAPGGLHLMLIAPHAELTVGADVAVTLTFEHAPAQTVMLTVRPLVNADVNADEPVTPHAGHHEHH